MSDTQYKVGDTVYILAKPMGSRASDPQRVFKATISVSDNNGNYEVHALNPDGSFAGTTAKKHSDIYRTEANAKAAVGSVNSSKKARRRRSTRRRRSSNRRH